MSLLKLNSLREKIDSCDDILLEVLSQRFQHVSEIRDIKKELNLPHLDNKRFSDILKRLEEKSRIEGLDPNIIKDVLRAIHYYSSKDDA